jgi:hypothetical protein
MSRLLEIAKALAASLRNDALLTDEQIDALHAWDKFEAEEKTSAPYREILELWRQKCPSLVQPLSLDATRKATVDRFWKRFTSMEEVAEIFDIVAASPLLTGKVGKWQADLWWVLKPANLQNIIDGRYDERSSPVRRSGY